MLLHARDGWVGTVIDADTLRPVNWLRWVNTETGEYEAFSEEPNAAYRTGGIDYFRSIIYRGKCRLPVNDTVTHCGNVKTVTQPIPQNPQAFAQELHTIAEDYVKDYRRVRRIVRHIQAVVGIECDEPKCHKLATIMTGDEQQIDPQEAGGAAFERAVTVNVHKWCSEHFRYPVIRSIRGVEQEVMVGGPQ